ncbi:MAG: helix-turn-helix transcriptional regulator [Deinococcales bacterium]
MASFLEVQVLIEMLKAPQAKHYGNALIKALDIPSGSLYPLLIKLEERGYLQSAFEDNPRLKRGERHYYWFTDVGLDYALDTCKSLCEDYCKMLSQRQTLVIKD